MSGVCCDDFAGDIDDPPMRSRRGGPARRQAPGSHRFGQPADNTGERLLTVEPRGAGPERGDQATMREVDPGWSEDRTRRKLRATGQSRDGRLGQEQHRRRVAVIQWVPNLELGPRYLEERHRRPDEGVPTVQSPLETSAVHEHEAVEVENLGRRPAAPRLAAVVDEDRHTVTYLNVQIGSRSAPAAHSAPIAFQYRIVSGVTQGRGVPAVRARIFNPRTMAATYAGKRCRPIDTGAARRTTSSRATT